MFTARLTALILALGIFGLPPAMAQTPDEGKIRFTARIAGVTAGRIELRYRINGPDYALAAETTSAGLAGLFRPFTFANQAEGRESQGTLRPRRYEARATGGRAARETALRYDRGVPQVLTLVDDPRPDAPPVDPAEAKGAVDPLTLTWALLRDIPADQACQLDLRVYDGQRLSRLVQEQGPERDDGIECRATYRRLAGYAPEDLAKRRDFALSILYTPLPDGRLRPVELTLDSLFGPARMRRED